MLTDLQRIGDMVAALKTATEPDRELDAMIAVAVDWKEPDFDPSLMTCRQLADEHGMTWLVRNAKNSTSIWRNIPAYTSSYDAAFSLAGAEGNRRFEFGTYAHGDGWAYADIGDSHGEVEAHANEPIAITAAILAAHVERLEAQQEESA